MFFYSSPSSPSSLSSPSSPSSLSSLAYDHSEALRLLLAYDCDVDARDDDGWTPLFWAAANGYDHMCEELYNLGADIDATGNDEIEIYSPLMLAQKQGHTNVVDLIKSWHLDDL